MTIPIITATLGNLCDRTDREVVFHRSVRARDDVATLRHIRSLLHLHGVQAMVTLTTMTKSTCTITTTLRTAALARLVRGVRAAQTAEVDAALVLYPEAKDRIVARLRGVSP